jgi:hypothetical protein
LIDSEFVLTIRPDDEEGYGFVTAEEFEPSEILGMAVPDPGPEESNFFRTTRTITLNHRMRITARVTSGLIAFKVG